MQPTTASLAMTVGGFGLVLAILLLTLGALIGPMQEIVAESRSGAGRVDDLIGSGQSIASMVEAIAPQLLAAAGLLVAALAGLVISVVLGAILTFYLLRDGARGFEAATARLTTWRHDELKAAAERATGVLGGYMIGTGAISAVGAATQFLIMWLLGIPLALPLAVLSFFGGFIPYIGSLLTTGLAFLVTVATGDDAGRRRSWLIFTLVFNIVQGNIVAPLVYSRAVSIHPAIVLLAIPAGAASPGWPGCSSSCRSSASSPRRGETVLRVLGNQPEDVVEGASPGPDLEPEPGIGSVAGPGVAAAPVE